MGLKKFIADEVKWTNEDKKAYRWCINHGIACCVVWAQGHTGPGEDFCVEIIIKGKSNFSPNFKKQEVMDKQVEYYKYYYDKYNKSS